MTRSTKRASFTDTVGLLVLLGTLAWLGVGDVQAREASDTPAALNWPQTSRECRPWAYNWWLASAVDKENLTREMERYHEAGMGGVHIIPIYGAKGQEDRYIEYLTPEWLEMMGHAVAEAERLGMGVDMTTGTGWCFGGPNVSVRDANVKATVKKFEVKEGQALSEKVDPAATQALVAFSNDGKTIDLTKQIAADGTVDWKAAKGAWTVYAVSQTPTRRMVKRAAPGGAGYMVNLLSGTAMDNYLERFTKAFEDYDGPMPRAMYHDSYEYASNWAPDLFEQFEQRRGYRLQDHLDAMFGGAKDERAARVKCDYRETISDVMAEDSLRTWVAWSHKLGCRTRNQAHGSPGNLLDLYAVADIPETEMFRLDRNPLVSKFASSAAHVMGKHQVAAETGTWMSEHFTETLAQMKDLVDELFVAGVNHVVYHGTCYSPDDVPWPGWLFYASTEMNPRNSIWHDVGALNGYIARCQAVLQAGRPDNDILIYWPIHDFWHNPSGMDQGMTVHHTQWLIDQPIGRVAKSLWDVGFTFDYISDRQLGAAGAKDGRIEVPGGFYKVVVVPSCERIPLETFARLLQLAKEGATVIFEDHLPGDVPGLANLTQRQTELRRLAGAIELPSMGNNGLRQARHGDGQVIVGPVDSALAAARVVRETLGDDADVLFIRRGAQYGRDYFLANRGDTPIDGRVSLAMETASVAIMDPMSGDVGMAESRSSDGTTSVRLQLPPGHSVVLRAFTKKKPGGPAWKYLKPAGDPTEITGTWHVEFLEGGPKLPASYDTTKLASWANRDDAEAQRFAGTARYTLTFDCPGNERRFLLDLGKVAQSARIRINGRELGTRFMHPFHVAVDGLKRQGNVLQIEVTNVSANRIRDLDRRGVKWRNFHDINFVNSDYKPFNASKWPLADSGLLGPVTLTPLETP